MRLRAAAVSAIFVALVLPATGCASIRAAFTPEPTVVTREATVAAAAAAVDGELPADTPAKLPLWPGAAVKASEAKGASYSLLLNTEDRYEDVLSGLTVGFQRAGWEVVDAGDDGSVTVLEVSGDGFEGVVTISAEDAGSSIEYLLTKSEN